MTKQPSKKLISPDEAERAIYLDYEGNINAAPALLGWMDGESLYGAIVDPAFATCTGRWRVGHVEVHIHEEILSDIVGKAVQESRVIVTWSEHDYRIMHNALKPSLQRQLLAVYRNAIPTAKQWHRQVKGVPAPDRSLGFFMEVLGYQVPEKYGQGVVGNALRLIRSQLDGGRVYSEMTSKARESWRQVVKHNMHDLQAMKLLVLEAAQAQVLAA